MSRHIRFISAGAGSGKTYRITEELQALLASGKVQPAGVIATTFTRLAATELRERVRQKLMADGHTELATQMGQALIGTVNGVCGELLQRFAFEAGLSPDQKVLEEEQAGRLFASALEGVLGESSDRIRKLNVLAQRLGVVDVRTRRLTWRDEVMAVAAAARANNLTPEEIRACAAPSADDLLAMFAAPSDASRDLDAELLGAVNHALANISTETDATKVTQQYLTLLKGVQAALLQGRLQWSEWLSLAKKAPGAKSRSLAEAVQMVAGELENHPQLHADIRQFCDEVFDLAATSIEAYQEAKELQGLLDFVDQEQRMYRLLDEAHVRETLAGELQVLFVDEFQDTSPIQLALFMKLAALAEQVVWVGDIKQAIYGFRGSDPALMQAVLEGVTSKGGQTDVLEFSWRSRPVLVEWINEIFVPAFSKGLSREQVALAPKREEKGDEPAVHCWHCAGSNWTRRANDIAFGIQELLEAGYRITDKSSGALRPAGYGDIAVLCRTNSRLQEIAEACARAGIPVAYKRPGLLATPEGVLALAALRRLADRRDSLASAEIVTLTRSESPADWLTERLSYLGTGGDPSTWGETGEDALPELAALAAARDERTLLTPREALEVALVKGGVRETAIAWGPTSDHIRHRLRNIDLLLEYAAQYEDQCDLQNVAATLPGLVLWLYELKKRGEDWQAEASDGRAVTLVTHHGAKGLEWPIVIAVDLDSTIRPRLWGLTVLQRREGFDIDAPLAGRALQYWPWPFGNHSTGIGVLDTVATSQVGIAAHAAAVEETQRLLYVSLTRARDCLVVPLYERKPSGEWLESLGAPWMLPTEEGLVLPNCAAIPAQFSRLEAPEDWRVPGTPPAARWVEPGMPRDDLLQRYLSPSSAEPLASVRAGDIVDIGERLALAGVTDVTALGLALHAIIAAEIGAPDDDTATRAGRILRDWGFVDTVSPTDALAAARRFIGWVRDTFAPIAWHVEHPMVHVLDTGQVVRGFIDLLLETPAGYVVIDHKATPLPRTEWRAVAESYSGQLARYRNAVQAATGKDVVGAWIYFAVGGGAIQVEVG